MDQANCNLCGSGESTLLYSTRDMSHNLDGRFNYVKCVGCGLIYLTPRPNEEEIGYYYPEDYLPYKRAIDDEPFFLMRFFRRIKIQARCSRILKFKTSGRILDVGCATGIFLAEMRKHPGWEVIGVEPNQRAAHYAQERLQLTIFNGMLNDADFPDSYFDAITFWDVFEHLFDPMAILKEVRRLLKPGGIVVLSLPDIDSLDAKLFGRYWIGLDAPRHFFVFSVRTLTQALNRSGFEVVANQHFEGGYFTFVASLGHFMNDKIVNERVRKVIRKGLYLPGIRFVFEPFFLLLNKVGKGSILTVYATKDLDRRLDSRSAEGDLE
jgi:SAM-dependent methyltransferase